MAVSSVALWNLYAERQNTSEYQLLRGQEYWGKNILTSILCLPTSPKHLSEQC